jgi:hypothetical protein
MKPVVTAEDRKVNFGLVGMGVVEANKDFLPPWCA